MKKKMAKALRPLQSKGFLDFISKVVLIIIEHIFKIIEFYIKRP